MLTYRFDDSEAVRLIKELTGVYSLQNLEPSDLYTISKLIRRGRTLRDNKSLIRYMTQMFPTAIINTEERLGHDKFGNPKPYEVLLFSTTTNPNAIGDGREEEDSNA